MWACVLSCDYVGVLNVCVVAMPEVFGFCVAAVCVLSECLCRVVGLCAVGCVLGYAVRLRVGFLSIVTPPPPPSPLLNETPLSHPRLCCCCCCCAMWRVFFLSAKCLAGLLLPCPSLRDQSLLTGFSHRGVRARVDLQHVLRRLHRPLGDAPPGPHSKLSVTVTLLCCQN